jgi:hypothetical protein
MQQKHEEIAELIDRVVEAEIKLRNEQVAFIRETVHGSICQLDEAKKREIRTWQLRTMVGRAQVAMDEGLFAFAHNHQITAGDSP